MKTTNPVDGWVNGILARHAYRFGGKRAPKGGAQINGRFYPGGQWIPASELARAAKDPKQKFQVARVDNPLVMPAVWADRDQGRTPAEAKSMRRQADRQAKHAGRGLAQAVSEELDFEIAAEEAEAKAAAKRAIADRLRDKMKGLEAAAWKSGRQGDAELFFKARQFWRKANSAAKQLEDKAAIERLLAKHVGKRRWTDAYQKYTDASDSRRAWREATQAPGFEQQRQPSIVEDLWETMKPREGRTWGEFAGDVADYASTKAQKLERDSEFDPLTISFPG